MSDLENNIDTPAQVDMPAQVETPEQGLGYGPDRLALIIGQFLDLFAERLTGGSLEDDQTSSNKDILTALDRFKTHSDPEIKTLLIQSWGNLSKAAEEVYWAKMRKKSLERLMIRNFSYLLAPVGEAPVQNISFSRRIIPAFIDILNRMVGAELMATYRTRAQELVNQQKQVSGNAFDWTTLYDSPRAHAITNDILIYIVPYFKDIEERRLWMVDLLNDKMPKAQDEAEKNWHFDDLAFIQLITALYANLVIKLEIPQSVEELKKQYGEDNLNALQRMREALKIDSQKVHARYNTA